MNYRKSQKRATYTNQVSKKWTLELFKSPLVYARKCFGVPWHSHLLNIKEMTPWLSSVEPMNKWTLPQSIVGCHLQVSILGSQQGKNKQLLIQMRPKGT